MSENDRDPGATRDLRVIRDLRELASDVPPAHDLWPAIAAKIDPGARVSTTFGHGSGAGAGAGAGGANLAGGGTSALNVRRYAIGLAAAVALVAIGAWLGRSTLPGATDAGVAGVAANGSGSAALTRRAAAPDTTVQPVAYIADPRYRAQRAELLAHVDAKIAALPPDSHAKVRESLVTIQKAVADLEAALGREPSYSLLQELLVNARQDEMRVLTTIAEAGAAGQET